MNDWSLGSSPCILSLSIGYMTCFITIFWVDNFYFHTYYLQDTVQITMFSVTDHWLAEIGGSLANIGVVFTGQQRHQASSKVCIFDIRTAYY